jgi:REP element-mobilizing transposase RayT
MERTTEFYQRNLPHIIAYERPLFITFATRDRRILPPGARTIALSRCVFGHPNFYWLDAAVVMPDHVHLVLTIQRQRDRVTLRRIMKGIKGTSARQINRLLNWTGSVWQDESFDRVLRSHERSEVIEYVLQNPVEAALVDRVDEYPWLWRSWAQTGMSVLHGN